MNTKILAAALGLLVAGGAVANVSAATVVKTTKTVAHHAIKPVATKTIVPIAHRPHHLVRLLPGHRPHHLVRLLPGHRPHHLVRLLPGHRLAPRVHLAKAITTKHVAKTTIVR